jgi:hypothetical protein
VQSNIKKIISKLFLVLFPVDAQAMNCSYVSNKIVKTRSSLDENETSYPAGVPSSAELSKALSKIAGPPYGQNQCAF